MAAVKKTNKLRRMQKTPRDLNRTHPSHYDPFDSGSDRFGQVDQHDVAQFDSDDGRWGWVRLGLLSLMFGYFCIPLFVVASGVVTRMDDKELIQAVLIVGVSATLIPVAIGWALCGLTPLEVGTRQHAVIVALATASQMWVMAGRLWPDVVQVPGLLTSFRSLISIIAISCMLRYLQGTFEYLRPGHQDTWAKKLQWLTNWCTFGLIAGVVVILAIGMPPMAVLIPILFVVFFALLAMMILFWGCLFRLWFLLRGEGQFAGNDQAW